MKLISQQERFDNEIKNLKAQGYKPLGCRVCGHTEFDVGIENVFICVKCRADNCIDTSSIVTKR